VPTPWRSGTIDREQGISKAGNRRLRHIMIELAWLWVRHQPDSALSRWFRARVGTERGRIRRVAIVALARKLLIALWRYVTHGEVPEGAVLKRRNAISRRYGVPSHLQGKLTLARSRRADRIMSWLQDAAIRLVPPFRADDLEYEGFWC